LKTAEAIGSGMTQEDQSDDEPEQCPECGSEDLLEDAKRAEIVCGDCGLVVVEDETDQGPEWRTFDPSNETGLGGRIDDHSEKMDEGTYLNGEGGKRCPPQLEKSVLAGSR